MRQIFFIGMLVIFVQSLAFAKATSLSTPTFKCEEKATVEENNNYLDSLVPQIQKESSSPQVKSVVPLMVQLIKKVLCSYQIDEDITVFEYISGYEGTKVFAQAKAQLSDSELATLNESLILVNSKEAE